MAERRRNIVVTGASRGIGEAVARRLAGPGRCIALVARTVEDLERVARAIEADGGEAEVIPADLSSAEAAGALAEELVERVGRVDGIVLNAGISNDVVFRRAELDAIDLELQVNYLAPVHLVRHLLDDMLEQGRGDVIFVSSLTAVVPFPGNASYAGSKAATFAFARSLGVELEEQGIHVGVVLPGYTDTGIAREAGPEFLPSMSADAVAKAVASCLDDRKGVVIPGWTNQLALQLFGSFPNLSDSLLEEVASKILPGFDG